MPESDFEAQKSTRVDKKRFGNIYENHPATIVNQHFGFSSIVRFEKARNHHFECQEVILKLKNQQEWTKRDLEIFTQITLNDQKSIFWVFSNC